MATTRSKTPEKRSYHNGDAIARALHGLDHGAIVKVVKANKLWDRYADLDGKLNNGRFRMLAGNSLRAKVLRGEPVKVGKITIERLNQRF